MGWDDRPQGCVLWERADLPESLQTVSDDAFHHFEVLPLDRYTGGAYEVAEQLLEQAANGVAEQLIDEAIAEGHKVFALVQRIPYRGLNARC